MSLKTLGFLDRAFGRAEGSPLSATLATFFSTVGPEEQRPQLVGTSLLRPLDGARPGKRHSLPTRVPESVAMPASG